MTTANIITVNDIRGTTTATLLSTSFATQISNPGSSGKAYKVNTIIVSNTNTSAVNVSLEFYRDSVGISLGSEIGVPANASVVLISKDTSIYLDEGDAIRAKGSSANYLNFVGSWEELYSPV